MSKKVLSVLLAVMMLLTIIPVSFVSALETGDVNGDGKIMATDARIVLRASVGLEELDEIQTIAADVDGKPGISAADARLILRASVGLETLTPAHTHNYKTESITVPASCEKEGEKKLSCECGEYITEKIPATGHTEKKVPAVAPTCTKSGLTEGKKCSVCDKVITAQTAVPATGHTEKVLPAVSASCTATGLTEGKKCSVCGEITVAQEVIPVKAHTEVVLPEVPATCTETGLTEGKKCSVCGEVTVKQNEIPAKGHSMGNWTVSAPASCTAAGTEKRECSVCGEKETREIAVLAHTETALPAVPATCTATGLTEGKKCSVCDKIIVAQNIIPATGHTEEILPAVPATCTETGLTEGKKCSVCGETIAAQTVVPASGHTEETIPAVSATCTETGLTEGKKCTVCGITITAQTVVPASGHSPEEVTIAATCKEYGYKIMKCSVCGLEDESTRVEIEGYGDHNMVLVEVEATCGQPGYKIMQCSVCELNDESTYTETEPAKDHIWGEAVVTAPTCTEEGFSESTCTVCEAVKITDYTDPTGHTIEWKETTEATCKKEGEKKGSCTVCGDEITEVLPLTSHKADRIEYTKNPCLEITYCSICGDKLSETEFHEIRTDRNSIVPATCTTPKTEEQYCYNCNDFGDHLGTHKNAIPGKMYKTRITASAKGHSATLDTELSTNATCEKNGKWVYSGTCSVCGADLDHTEVIIDAKGHNLSGTQTCTTDVVCSNPYCDFENGVVLERFGHDNKLATDAYGKTVSTFYCARCGEETEDKLAVFNEVTNSIKTYSFCNTYSGNKDLSYFRKTATNTSYSRFDFGMFTSAIRDMYEQEMANTPDEYTRINNGNIRVTLPIEYSKTSELTASDIDGINVERLSGVNMSQLLADYNPSYTNEAQIARLKEIKDKAISEPVIKVTVDVKDEKYSQIKSLPATSKSSLEKIFSLNIRNDADEFKNENGELKQTVTESGDGFNITMTMNLKEISSNGQVTYYFLESTYEPIVAIYDASITMEQAIDMTFKIGVFSLNGKMDPIVESNYSYVYLFPNFFAAK